MQTIKKLQLKLKILVCLLFAVLLFSSTFNSGTNKAFGNSTQTNWTGVTATGAIVTDENCPIEVTNENLTFDLPTFPQNYYFTDEEFETYNGKVTAEYTFSNPADYQVNATLVFPIGGTPDYGYNCNENFAKNYDITIDDIAVDKTMRHFLNFSNEELDVSKLKNDYVADDFYSPEMMVTCYSFDVVNLSENESSVCVSCSVNCDYTKTKIMFYEQSGFSIIDDKISVRAWVKNNDKLTVAVFGEAVPISAFNWEIYKNEVMQNKINGVVTASAKVYEYELKDYVKFANASNGEISDIDWYNIYIDYLADSKYNGGILDALSSSSNIKDYIINCYQYEISIPAKGQIINKVTATMYPSIDGNYDYPVYSYKYYLSPAKSWASFSNLNIKVNTPYYLSNSSVGALNKRESADGYDLFLETLPDGELEFNLCEVEKPQRVYYSYYPQPKGSIWFGIVLLVVIAASPFIVLGILHINRKKKVK